MAKQSAPEAPPISPEPEARQPHEHRFFTWIRSLGLIRQPGWIGGVSAGIADRIGVDVNVVRGVLVVVAVLGGPAVLLYALAWLVLPDTHNRIHLEDLMHGRVETPVVAIAILAALSLLPVAQGFWWFGSLYWGQPSWGDSAGRAIWTLVILGALIWFVVWISRRTGGVSAPRSTPATTDDRPETIPSPPDSPPAPPTLPADASSEQLASWREQQALWKEQHDAYRRAQADQRLAASQAAMAEGRRERLARAAIQRRARARTRSHPIYSLILGLIALIAGAITALALGNWTPDVLDYLAGAAVAVGILALGIIVNGVRGRRSGGASGLAVILLIPILFAGIVPQSQYVHYSGHAVFTPHGYGDYGSSATYLSGFGNATVDLTNYFSAPRPAFGGSFGGSSMHLWAASGNITVYVPKGEYVYVNAYTGNGHVTWHRASATGDHVYHSSFARYYAGGDRNWKNAARDIVLTVSVGSGNITVVQAPSRMGFDK